MIRYLHGLARTGGTIISRCLACMDGVALLSEITPHACAVFDPRKQAKEWYGVDVMDGPNALELIAEAVAPRALVVRVWDHVDFVPSKFNPTPSRELSFRGYSPRAFLVRHPLAMWASLKKKTLAPSMASGLLTPDNFSEGYRAYANHSPALAYEDFCAHPNLWLRALCFRLQLPYDAGWRDKWRAYWNVTGDLGQLGARSTIDPPPSCRLPDEEIARFLCNADYQESCRQLGYDLLP